MKRVISLLVVLAMVLVMVPAAFAVTGTGSMEDPYVLEVGDSQDVTIPANGEVYLTLAGPADLTITGEAWMVPYVVIGKGESLNVLGTYTNETPEEGISLKITSTNEDSSMTLTVTLSAISDDTLGTEENPHALVLDKKTTVSVPANGQVYYQWTAEEAGTLTITIDGDNYYYTVVNGASTDMNPESVKVAAGDVIQIVFETYDYSADSYDFTASFKSEAGSGSPSGTEADPYALVLDKKTTVNVPDFGQVYYQWTAEEAGTLTITIDGDNYYYTVVIGTSTDMNPESVKVAAGDVVQIVFETYDYFADSYDFTATFEANAGGSGSYEPFGTTVYVPANFDDEGTAHPDFHTDTVTATGAGKITVTTAGDPGCWFNLYNPGYPDGGSVGFPRYNSAKQTYTYDVTEAGVYTIELACYSPADVDYANGYVSYEITFTPGDVETKKPAYVIKDDAITAPGTYDISMEYADVTIVPVTPDATGVYKITVVTGDALLGNYGGSDAYIFSSDSVTHGAALEWTCQEAGYWTDTDIQDEDFNWITIHQFISGQTMMLGIKPADGVTTVRICVEKIGEYTPTDIPTITYENKADLKDFTVPDGATLGDYVDVYEAKTHTAVLGKDGFYHLDKADGPILLLDLDYLGYRLTNALGEGRGVMYVNGTDKDGNPVRYDIADACKAYGRVADENGYYPLTEDLIFFYKDYAGAQGVYSWVLNEESSNPKYNPDSVWMYACRTMTLPDENPKAGDGFSVALMGVLLLVSGMGVAALTVSKKKFF